MKLIQDAIKMPVTVAVAVILLVLFGLLSLKRVPVQLTPDVDQARVSVQTRWGGASPQEVEREIVDRQEEKLKNVDGLLRMTSESQDGAASITLEFAVGSDLDAATLRVANALEQVRQAPTLADKPIITAIDPTDSAMAWLTLKRLPGNERDINTYRDLCEDIIKPAFERIPGLARANVFGGQEQELRLTVDAQRLAAYALSVDDLVTALRGENRDISAGDFDEGKRRYVVRTLGQFASPADLESVIVAQRGMQTIYVRDIGTVGFALQKSDFSVRHFGSPSIAMNCQRAAGANVLEVMDQIKETLNALNKDVLAAKGVSLTQVYDQTLYIHSAIRLVRQNIIVGGLLAILVLFLFLRSHSAVAVIATAIPISIIGTFLVMTALGRNVNVISLAGMSFAVGMVVDSSIVVLENIMRHRAMGKTRRRAAYDGTSEVWGAILASTLTTMSVFIPIVFMKDEIGQLYRDIAIAISSSVALSLVVSITVIPSLSARILGGRKTKAATPGRLGEVDTAAQRFAAWISGLVYRLSGKVSTRVLITVIMTGLAIGLARLLLVPAEYLPQGNRNMVFSIMLPPPGYSLDELSRIGSTLEEKLSPHFREFRGVKNPSPEQPVIQDFFFVASGRNVFMGGIARDADRVGELVPKMREALSGIPGMISIVQQASLFGRAVGKGRNIDLEVTGPDLPELMGLAGRTFGQLRGMFPGAQIRPIPGLDLGNPEVTITPNRELIAKLGLSTETIGRTVDVFLDGRKVDDYKHQGEDIDLVLRGTDALASRSQDLASLPIMTHDGQRVNLGAIASIEVTAGPEQINHIERRRAVTLSIIPPQELPLQSAMETIREQITRPLTASGEIGGLTQMRLAGTADDLAVTWGSLKWSLFLAVVIAYLLMAALFESFLYPAVIMFSVPLAAVGGLAGLRVMNIGLHLSGTGLSQPLDTLTMLGFVILIGTVVNNAILIVHQSLNHMRDEHMAPREAIRDAVRTRIRPIFMSTTTSVLGMMPLVLFPGAGSELYRGIGSVVIGGLVVSTIFTLILVPVLFSLAMAVREHVVGSVANHLFEDDNETA